VLILATIGAYVAYAAWHLQRAGLGRALLWILAPVMLVLICLLTTVTSREFMPSALASTVTGAMLLGAGMGAMLLGHYYLTAPWMSLDPLLRLTGATLVSALLRGVPAGLATVGLIVVARDNGAATLGTFETTMFLGVRWIVGIIAPIVLAVMVWRTVRLKATQAATGILYVVVICTLIGEVTAIAMYHVTGAPL
jgi:hypothetical protein